MKIILSILLVTVLLSLGYVDIKKKHMEKKVETYLIENKGYDAQEIKSIEGLFSKMPVWSVRVIFEDESNINYYYQIESDKVIQTREYPAKNVNTSFLQDFIEGKMIPKHRENNQ
ncbi:DUF3139 domain-containing protein [Bacillus sp. Cr_A10]|uniref:DUF3139 domain-containing protein n=1 Tax=Bacillus sp. Cr_A10 TaxID=3033993 RepID=UPI0023DC8A5D|nr:DUF3139 domain-containing protein [Bacillus sp. Cr_A10]MDF2066532.1 DUF3139 domain-containing protein [Bacillus sp. Cr_A10]